LSMSKRMSKKTWVEGVQGDDKKKFRTRSMEKHRRMAYVFRMTVKDVRKTGQIDSIVNVTFVLYGYVCNLPIHILGPSPKGRYT